MRTDLGLTPIRARPHLLGVRVSVRRDADRRRLGVGSVRSAARARRPQPAVGGGHDPDRPVVERRLARGVPRARRHRRRRRVSGRDARVHLVAAGSRARLRAGHHAQLRAAGRRGHAAHRPRDRRRDTAGASRSSSSAPPVWSWTAVWVASFRNTPDEHPWVTATELAEIRRRRRSDASRRWATDAVAAASSAACGCVTLVDFCYGWSLWVFLTWLPSYLSDARGFELDQIALMTTLPLAGWRGGRHARRRDLGRDLLAAPAISRLARRTPLVVGPRRRVCVHGAGDR